MSIVNLRIAAAAHDVRAASYGYGGHTQEWRYHRASTA